MAQNLPDRDVSPSASGTMPGSTTAPESGDGQRPATGVDRLGDDPAGQLVQDPAELIRIGAMLQRLNQSLTDIDLDEQSVDRLIELHRRALATLSGNLQGDLVAEVRRLVPTLSESRPTESEVRLAHLQLVSWLERLFQGLQMMAASQDLQRRLRALAQPGPGPDPSATGTYL